MDIAVVGVNHNITPISIREKVTFTESKKIDATTILTDKGIEETVILSTCNRSEIYIASENIDYAADVVVRFYSEYFNDAEIGKYLFCKKYDEAIRHLYEVCSGLDSIVIGEDQILGQVKDAIQTAIELKGSSKLLNKLFREAITVAKDIKTETKISDKPLSISYIGIKKLKENMDSFADKTALLVGLGKMGTLALTHLREYSIGKVYVANRNISKSIELANTMTNVDVIKYENLTSAISDCDILVCATSSHHIIVRKEDIKTRQKSLYILDLALPRDVDENVKEIENVVLYDVDSLKSESLENERIRKKLLENSMDKINQSIEEFYIWKDSIAADPIIESMNKKCQNIKADTLSYIFRKIDLTHKEKKIIDKMVESSMKRLIREAILNLKGTKEEEKLNEYAKLIHELFEFE